MGILVAADHRRLYRSVVVVARRHLTATLTAVRDQFTRVVESASENPEFIHKLRVATRRALAAVRAFDDYLPKRAFRRVKRTLRAMRQSAGEARDWDVFFAGVAAWSGDRPDADRPGLDALLGWAAAKRDSARTGLHALAEDHPHRADRLIAKTVDAIRPPKHGKITSYTERVHERLTAQFAALSEALAGDTEDDTQLHRVRLMGKKLRYTGELFVEHRSKEDRERIDPILTELQDILGRFNDGAVAGRHLEAFAGHFRQFHPVEWERVRDGVEALVAHHLANREAERQRFHDWRTRWRNSTDKESDIRESAENV